MSVSTNGQICFGVVCEEDTVFPWDEDNDGLEDWWTYKILGFKHSFELFNAQGEYIGKAHTSPEDISRYFEERIEFDRHSIKCPVELVNYRSGDYPMYILALSESIISARRGYPEKIDLSQLKVEETRIKELIDFCNVYGIEYQGEPSWYLSSYWG